ncbi:MAG: VanW family protein [Clostridia bacterium]|nr:VanW family protein [Clostridia bacterium]
MDNDENKGMLEENTEKLSIEEKVIPTEEIVKEETIEAKVVNKEEEPKKHSKQRKVIFIVCVVLVSIILFLGGIVCVNKMNPNAYKNLHVLGMNMSGKNLEKIAQELNEKFSGYKPEEKYNVYQDTESIYTIMPTEIEFSINIPATAKKILEFGRTGNLLKDNIAIMKAFFSKVEIIPEYNYSQELLDEKLNNIDLTLKDRFVDDKFSVDENTKKLIITRGKSGNSINYEEEGKNLVNKFANSYVSGNNDTNITLAIVQKKPIAINVEEVYGKVKRDAKDAYIDETVSPIKLVSEVVGFDFNVEELKAVIEKEENKAEGKVIEFDLKVIEPKVKLADITYKLYKDKLAGLTTYFDAGQAARANNLKIALNYLNGKIIMPGETFSYNAAIGDTTVAKGYQEAATFKGGGVVNELGGGICQTTSTLYDVALMANMQIVQRHQHGLPVGYVKPSLDATVYSPNLDFKFKNTRKYPVKIVTSYSSGGSLNISIFGTKEEVEYDITLSSSYIKTIPFQTKYTYDENMYEGEQVIVSKGVNGYVSEGYITKMLNGKVVESRMLSRDTYNAQSQIVKVGTKKQ